VAEKHNIFHGQFIKTKDKLVICGADSAYKMFIAELEEGQKVEIFMEVNEDDGTIPQLAKVHVCIRELAKELGYTFEDMKIEVKMKAGLCVKKEIGGEIFMICKSFGDCSKDELGLAVEAIKQIGEIVGINFH
jgi:hypothetical protein